MNSHTGSDFKISTQDENLISGEESARELERRQFFGRSSTSEFGSKPSRTVTQVEEALKNDHVESPKPEQRQKLGTFTGVFMPTTLNVLSILMFLRFGFILGQVGILGMIVLLLVSYTINLLTTLSISAISTNGTVRGGGAYYMISRSLGPEFGGSIGVVFYIGQALNAGMNVVGFCEPLLANFGSENGVTGNFLPEGQWWNFFYSTCLLIICTGVCMVGSSVFAKAGNVLFVVLLVSTFSIPLSILIVQPFADPRFGNALYTGFSWQTIRENLYPHFTSGAAGSQILTKENFRDMFGIFFPATSGIFAGASMSGDLRKPSKSIPKGTLWGLLLTFISYSTVILSMGTSISRQLLYKDIQVLQSVSFWPPIILLGELSTSLFSAIVGIIGSAKLLQAVARDDLLPFTSAFAKGTKATDDPLWAVLFTYAFCQITLLFDINQIAMFITMAFLMTFIVTNLACFLLKIASAPNFRPSFRYFNWFTAASAAFACLLAMFVVDGLSASGMLVVLMLLFLLIHYVSPPKPWGDVSQSLIYHQVRKYLLRLRQDHVKFWRPQILLLVDDPRSAWNLIQFCNHLKKGSLYILGHIVTTQDFQDSYSEIKRQQNAWIKLRDISKVKAFVQIGAGPDVVWGARNVYIGSGLGGMKPNITVLGFFETRNHYPTLDQSLPTRTASGSQIALEMETMPTDICRKEASISVTQWVNIIEDLLIMHANVAIAKGFPSLELPIKGNTHTKLRYIDLYPIQMSAQIVDENGETSALTTNFDTYTLILQMGAILRTVPVWKKSHILRVVVFVEFEEDVEEEHKRVGVLLESLRIKAEILVLCLSTGAVGAYNTIVQGKPDGSGRVERYLGNDEWWQELKSAREEWTKRGEDVGRGYAPPEVIESLLNVDSTGITPSGLGRVIDNKKRRHTMSGLQRMGVSFSIQTSKLLKSDIRDVNDISPESDSDSETDSLSTGSEIEEPSDPHKRLFVRRGSSVGPGGVSGMSLPHPRAMSSSAESTTSGAKQSPWRRSMGGLLAHNRPDRDRSQSPMGRQPPDEEAIDFNKKPSPSSSAAKLSKLQSLSSKSTEAESSSGTSTPYKPSPKPSAASSSTDLASTTSSNRPKKLKPNFSSTAIPQTKVVEEAEEGRPTIMFDPMTKPTKSSLSQRESGNKHSGSERSRSVQFSESTPLLSHSNETNYTAPQTTSPTLSTSSDEKTYLSFNDLPARAQHVILNDLMRTTSDGSAVIFSTLPAPALGTHLSEEDSLEYVESLKLWCEDLPPVILLHSQTMTVTTAL